MPNYVMSCYRVPKAVTKELTSVVFHFLWNLREIEGVFIGSHGINYVNLK